MSMPSDECVEICSATNNNTTTTQSDYFKKELLSSNLDLHRYVPVGLLGEDAPGWQNKHAEEESSFLSGPICWKCKGSGRHHNYTLEQIEAMKQSKSSKIQAKLSKLGGDANGGCTICSGSGRLPTKKREREALHKPGEITSPRKSQTDWKMFGPLPYALWLASASIYPPPPTCESTTVTEDSMTLASINNDSASSSRKDATTTISTTTSSTTTHEATERMKSVTFHQAIQLVRQTEQTKQSVYVCPRDHFSALRISSSNTIEVDSQNKILPPWIPRSGEQLCNLVGRWKLLQRVGSHRWTTDDLVTACVAARQVEHRQQLPQTRQKDSSSFHYLDLGCGNGSVLSMTMWKLCQLLAPQQVQLSCVGVEARNEAVELARRSLSFNVHYPDEEDGIVPCSSSVRDRQRLLAQHENVCPIDVKILHGDFRELLQDPNNGFPHNTSSNHATKFDLVTGTPPYFRVDFHTSTTTTTNNLKSPDATKVVVVDRAVINQGGMPTSRQSAPARCEFRGGIEAYCSAASLAMKDDGVFVVCENWENASRVHKGAKDAGLKITNIQAVKGNVSKASPLFAVYTMRKCSSNTEEEHFDSIETHPTLIVRDNKGKWTVQYAQEVLEWMAIPAMHDTNANNGQY